MKPGTIWWNLLLSKRARIARMCGGGARRFGDDGTGSDFDIVKIYSSIQMASVLKPRTVVLVHAAISLSARLQALCGGL